MFQNDLLAVYIAAHNFGVFEQVYIIVVHPPLLICIAVMYQ